ncbi:hypothetical protein [Streptococcus sp. X13SY08]|nr:hypothetical protein [Streptococcus sp. X13SY08]
MSIWQLPMVYMVIYLVTDVLFTYFSPIFGKELQEVLSSQIRATMLSVNAMFFSLSMIIIFPLTGLLIDG